MKKFLILSMAAFLVFGFTSWAAATTTIPYYEGHTTDPLLAATFWAIDGDADRQVTISSVNFGTLQYKYGATVWTPFTGFSLLIPTINGEMQVFLQYVAGGSGSEVSAASMTYTGKLQPSDTGSSLYHTVVANFSPGISVNTAAGKSDSVSPVPVPLPGAVWLLGAGLIGLVGVRRRKIQG